MKKLLSLLILSSLLTNISVAKIAEGDGLIENDQEVVTQISDENIFQKMDMVENNLSMMSNDEKKEYYMERLEIIDELKRRISEQSRNGYIAFTASMASAAIAVGAVSAGLFVGTGGTVPIGDMLKKIGMVTGIVSTIPAGATLYHIFKVKDLEIKLHHEEVIANIILQEL